MKIFVIIVTYNSIKWIEQCLKSIPENYFVIIVDNNSIDNTVAFAKVKRPEITLIEQKDNLGFGKANNIGISYALTKGADHTFLLNQDAYLVDECLDNLIQLQVQFPEYGILSPLHLNANMSKLDEKFISHLCYQGRYDFISDHVLKKSINQIYDVNFVNAAGWLLSKRVLETVGGFDPIFFHYGEDDNYCQRVLYHGFKIGVSTNALMIHDREERKDKPIKVYSKAYFVKKERYYKVQFANVLDDTALIKMNERLFFLKRNLLKSVFKLNFKELKNVKKELKLLQQIKNTIIQSNQSNKEKAPNYLSF